MSVLDMALVFFILIVAHVGIKSSALGNRDKASLVEIVFAYQTLFVFLWYILAYGKTTSTKVEDNDDDTRNPCPTEPCCFEGLLAKSRRELAGPC